MRNIHLFYVIALALFASPAVAQQYAGGTITTLNVDKSGTYARIYLNSTPINPRNCPSSGFYMLELPQSGSAAILAALFTAFAEQIPITMWVSGCTSGQYWGSIWPAVFDVALTRN